MAVLLPTLVTGKGLISPERCKFPDAPHPPYMQASGFQQLWGSAACPGPADADVGCELMVQGSRVGGTDRPTTIWSMGGQVHLPAC